ncbi:hypothetical protein GCM10022226_55780 [Sphaerisporangium flaviroseum]|uniref:OmpA-like domain-containing protein n=1 Tax=Sphaerisporangium flaviroseum TaxID=509199 RepID=A0ABP7IV33_9ACTN
MPPALVVLAVVLSAVAGPAARPTPDPTDNVPSANIDRAILDLKLTILPLKAETTQGSRTTITISSDVLFEFDKADLTPAATGHIATIAERLGTTSGVAQVNGYTDAIGATAYNLRLSQRRAQAVKRTLDRILRGTPRTAATGHGEAYPVAPNTKAGRDNPAGRAKNRRVTITFESAR